MVAKTLFYCREGGAARALRGAARAGASVDTVQEGRDGCCASEMSLQFPVAVAASVTAMGARLIAEEAVGVGDEAGAEGVDRDLLGR